MLISQVVSPENPADAAAAQKALRAACVRMPDREACRGRARRGDVAGAGRRQGRRCWRFWARWAARRLWRRSAPRSRAATSQLQDTGSRVLGEWMTLDAAPVLLDLAKTAPSDKYQGPCAARLPSLARQFAKSDKQRAEMCESALDASDRIAEQQLVLAVLERYPEPRRPQGRHQARQVPALKEDATRVALAIIQKLGDKAGDVRRAARQDRPGSDEGRDHQGRIRSRQQSRRT